MHQQHAICWMVQMENLEGAYGINSLLWEQRTFPDGGHYYYSPALVRLTYMCIYILGLSFLLALLRQERHLRSDFYMFNAFRDK